MRVILVIATLHCCVVMVVSCAIHEVLHFVDLPVSFMLAVCTLLELSIDFILLISSTIALSLKLSYLP